MSYESYVEFRRGVTVYVVDDGGLHYFKTATSANAQFPGAFDEADTEGAGSGALGR